MKNKILILAVVGLMAGIVLTGCQNKGEENDQETKASIGETKSDSTAVKVSYSEDWQNFKSASEQKIQANENSIIAFKEKLKKSSIKIKAKYNIQIANLEETNRSMKKKLEGYKNDGKGAWEDFKAGFNNDMDKLGKAVNDLTSDTD